MLFRPQSGKVAGSCLITMPEPCDRDPFHYVSRYVTSILRKLTVLVRHNIAFTILLT